ncbi:hypothetical protein SEA_APIARY_5 [Rhodococcus phage Apiary]|nr:hypothetical protein SEA_MASELOP_5 [Rhodococcus phage Maselop]WNM69813.1 hypothetical protein SEA_APIARY_5 [Rhodococcus phage Apiary]
MKPNGWAAAQKAAYDETMRDAVEAPEFAVGDRVEVEEDLGDLPIGAVIIAESTIVSGHPEMPLALQKTTFHTREKGDHGLWRIGGSWLTDAEVVADQYKTLTIIYLPKEDS